MFLSISTLLLAVFLAATRPLQTSDVPSCKVKAKTHVLLDIADFCLFKVKEFHSRSKHDEMHSYLTECEKEEMVQAYLDVTMNTLRDIKEIHPLILTGIEDQSENFTSPSISLEPLADQSANLLAQIRKQQKPTDCSEVLENGHKSSEVYTIWPSGKELEVFCDMDTDGGNWTVIQRRGNFSEQEDFYRDWQGYKRGFGNITKDFWLGNENIYTITNQAQYEVRFDLEDADGNLRFAMFDSFRIESEENDYTLHIGKYTRGEAGDSMTYHNGQKFSTKDKNVEFCGRERQAGWWYDYCAESNLNGVHIPGVEDRKGITWYSWHHYYSLAGSEIKLRRKRD